jgi:hypothetical protein
LARGSSDENIDSCIVILLDGCEVSVKWDVREMVLKNGTWEGVDFAEEDGLPSKRMPGYRRCFDAGAN